MTRTRLYVVGAIGVLAAASVVAGLLWSWPSRTGYETPERAVTVACHAATFLPGFPATKVDGGQIEIGWAEKGQPAGTGWGALLAHTNGGYTVKDCKFRGVTHA